MHHLVVLSILISSVQCCFTSTETIRWADDGHLSRHTRPEIWRYLYERYITFLLPVWVSRGGALLVRQLFTSEEQKRLVRGMCDTFSTHAGHVYDDMNIDCCAQNVSTQGRVFATSKRQLLRKRFRNRAKNCCVLIPTDNATDTSSVRFPFLLLSSSQAANPVLQLYVGKCIP